MARNPTPPVSSRYGAPLGRAGCALHNLDPDAGRIYLHRVRLNSGGYDRGGAYWGLGPPLFVAMDQTGETAFLRARSRNAAKAEILDAMPDARFFR